MAANWHRRILTVWNGYRKWLVLSLVLTIAGALCTLAIPLLSQALINRGILGNNLGVIIQYGGYMLVLTMVAAGCQVANTLIAVKFSERTASYLRTESYRHIQDLSFGNIDRMRPSDLLVRLTNDIQNVKIAIQQGILNLPLVPVMLIITILLIAFHTPALIGLMVVLLVVFTILLTAYLRFVLPVFTVRQEKYDAMNGRLQENLAGVRVVKAFVRQRLENDRFSRVAGEVRGASLRAQTSIAILIPTMLLVVNLGLAAIFFIGGTGVLSGTGFSIGEVIASIQYLFLLIMPFMILGTVLPAISAARPSFDRIYELLDTQPEVTDPARPAVFDPAAVKGRVVFDHVSFGYRTPEGTPGPLVLRDISVIAEPGETIGILGATGSGKSTLIHLLPRFYDVTEGRITLDGTDIRQIPQDTLRRTVAICLQQPNLFFGTIRENILFGADDRSDGNMIAAAEDADAAGFITNIPRGYDDAVARHGANFSGGQRQRLAIARTLAAKPKILILDDSTSACDVATEARIQDRINQRFAGVTKILVAQRISTVIAADRILLLDSGKIVASGTHEELLAISPEYREIYDSQLGRGIVGRVPS
ncbi:ABC transporter ATP-binding protein [Methanoregula sp.]|uniref:ABC transporter ATP-binding protein n=1 Tax=Methanoregula sp. TaxID=2052170 RepID=UPI002BFD92AC|nr:ABC transporter ATP-binding protein [Methanoregula sp.]HVP96293.1 ABC transporter ATP-binding protein [Methanoregula sp.]